MSRRRKYLILLCCTALLIAATLLLSRDREPSYEGRSLSEWLTVWGKNAAPGDANTEPKTAVARIGTNAIPFLLTYLDYELLAGEWKTLAAVNRLLHRVNSFLGVSRNWELRDREKDRATGATFAFAALGADAAQALPELKRRLNLPESSAGPFRAACALAYMGPLGFSPLVEALTNTSPMVRARAARAMLHLGTNALPAVPVLIQTVRDKDWFVAYRALETLQELNVSPKEIVPVLTENLQNPDSTIRARAAFHLAEYGKEARSAVPALLGRLLDPSSNVCAQATIALEAIAPEALTNALKDPDTRVQSTVTNVLLKIAPEVLTNVPARGPE